MNAPCDEQSDCDGCSVLLTTTGSDVEAAAVSDGLIVAPNVELILATGKLVLAIGILVAPLSSVADSY